MMVEFADRLTVASVQKSCAVCICSCSEKFGLDQRGRVGAEYNPCLSHGAYFLAATKAHAHPTDHFIYTNRQYTFADLLATFDAALLCGLD